MKLGAANFAVGNDIAIIPNSNQVYADSKNDPFTIYTTKNNDCVFYLPSLRPTNMHGDNYPMSLLYGGVYSNPLVPSPSCISPIYRGVVMNALRPYERFQDNNIFLYLYRKPWRVIHNMRISAYENDDFANYIIVRIRDGRDILVNVTDSYTLGPDVTFTEYNGVEWKQTTAVVDSVVGYMIVRRGTSLTQPQPPTVADAYVDVRVNQSLCWCDVALESLPFASDVNEDGIRLSALYPRAIESIYNALVRNPENNPFIIDGQPEYNKYNLSIEGGATDPSSIMKDYFCNWSDDRFTTALPSPQQGNAPLVGLTGMQGATLTIGNEDGTQQRIKLQVDADTGYVMAIDAPSSDASADLISEAWNAVDYGISINDFRNVNSYQRWKENNIRVGYKYRDQISAHYGVSVRFDVLDMPEFIGGVTRDVSVQQVTQTATNADGNLGDIAGQSYVMGEGHSIEQYCDEHGCIIGLMCVYPMPLYQDTLDKSLIKQDAFDFYFPEFGKIGNQPITNKEIAFSQSILQNNADDVFGYQRPWYEYLESLDEVHGLFQDDFRNFLLARDLGSVPQLGSDFLTLHADDLNNTFYSLDDKDKLLGQIYHKCTMKRPIPLYGIPSLE